MYNSQAEPLIKDTERGQLYTIRLSLLSCTILTLHLTVGVLEVVDDRTWKNWLFLGFHFALGIKEIVVYLVNRKLRKRKEKPTRFTFFVISVGIVIVIIHIIRCSRKENITGLETTIIVFNGLLLALKIPQMILLCIVSHQ